MAFIRPYQVRRPGPDLYSAITNVQYTPASQDIIHLLATPVVVDEGGLSWHHGRLGEAYVFTSLGLWTNKLRDQRPIQGLVGFGSHA